MFPLSESSGCWLITKCEFPFQHIGITACDDGHKGLRREFQLKSPFLETGRHGLLLSRSMAAIRTQLPPPLEDHITAFYSFLTAGWALFSTFCLESQWRQTLNVFRIRSVFDRWNPYVYIKWQMVSWDLSSWYCFMYIFVFWVFCLFVLILLMWHLMLWHIWLDFGAESLQHRSGCVGAEEEWHVDASVS